MTMTFLKSNIRCKNESLSQEKSDTIQSSKVWVAIHVTSSFTHLNAI